MRGILYAIVGGSLLGIVALCLIITEAFDALTLGLVLPVLPIAYLLESYTVMGSSMIDGITFFCISAFYFFIGALITLSFQKRTTDNDAFYSVPLLIFAFLITTIFLLIIGYQVTKNYRIDRSNLNTPGMHIEYENR